MQYIEVKGAKTHNLKNIDLKLPKNKLIVVTGVSGSGKSSLCIDTIYAEGQRRYIESLSSYARQFLDRMNKPDVEYIKGLCPAIALEQKISNSNNRSTIGTQTEIYDYLRILFTRIGITYSPKSGKIVQRHEIKDVYNYIYSLEEGKTIIIGFELNFTKKDFQTKMNSLLSKGFVRLFYKNDFHKIDDLIDSNSYVKNAFVVVKRMKTSNQYDLYSQNEIADSIQTAMEENNYECQVGSISDNSFVSFNNKFELDGILFEIPSIHFFNFNNSYGACQVCEGVGFVSGIDKELVIPNKFLSIYQGCIAPWNSSYKSYCTDFIKKVATINFPIHRSYIDLEKNEIALIWNGNEKKGIVGLNDFFEDILKNRYKIENRVFLSKYRGKTECKECNGNRIRNDANYVKINNKSISELLEMPIDELKIFFDNITLDENEKIISKRILFELQSRLNYLMEVGLSYLTLNRITNTLSGGEAQRVNLTKMLGSNLSDSLYVLDEPSIGLHPRDTHNLIKILYKLRDLGNTVLVVEHEEQIMNSSDFIVDVGKLAGINGGEIVFAGEYSNLKKNNTLTSKYLHKEMKVSRQNFVTNFFKYINILGARHFNLKEIDIKIPLGAITTVTGVSGSGKTTLIKKILYPALMDKIGNYIEKPGLHSDLTGDWSTINFVEMIDQNPLGRTSRSNPVTYVKAFDYIRELFANLVESKLKGLAPKDFSFNVKGGRCENCKGEGVVTVNMQFLADIEIQCTDCKGKRYQNKVLDIKYKNKNIYDILELTIEDAIGFFYENKNIYDRILPLKEIGLGYLKLGQSSSTLSGGEAQRVKLASYLNANTSTKNNLFIFDEPTTGLHFYDIQLLLLSMEKLINKGHTVIMIEHNTDIIQNSDWIIDLGPEAGENGGNLVFQGTIEEFKKSKNGLTVKYILN